MELDTILEWKKLYEEEKYTLRSIAKQYNTNHHLVKRELAKIGVEFTRKGRKHPPKTKEQKEKMSKALKGRSGFWKDKKMPKISLYKNMQIHIQWDIDLNFLLQFEDIEKLKMLNRLISNSRAKQHFTTDKYIQYIEKFYYDKTFNRQYAIYKDSNNKYDKPSIDHVIPLARGGTWDIDNLQIISWFDNRSKADMTPAEYNEMKNKYWEKEVVRNDKSDRQNI